MPKNIKPSTTSSEGEVFKKIDSGSLLDSQDRINQNVVKLFQKIIPGIKGMQDRIDALKLKNNITEKRNKKLAKERKKLDNTIKELGKGIKTLDEETKTMKIDFITVIGIFVSIFTFISIEIQILRYVCDFFRIAGFSLIIFGSLIGFIILLRSIFLKKGVELKLSCLFIFLFASGILLGSVPYIFEINNSCIVTEKNISEMEYRIEKLENQKINPPLE